MQSFSEWKQKQGEVEKPSMTQQFASGGSFFPPSEEKKEKPKSERNMWRWVGKQLMKPVGVAATELRGVGEFLGNIASIASPRVSASEGLQAAADSWGRSQQDVIDVITGKKETSFSKEFEAIGADDPLDKAMGFGADLLIDPLNVISPVKTIKGIGKVTKLDEPAVKLGQAIKNAPPARKLKMLFSNTTGNKEFDSVVRKFRDLRNYREGQVIDQAVGLQKNIKKVAKGLGENVDDIQKIIVEGLENPDSLIRPGVTDEVKTMVDTLSNTYKELLTEARDVGLKVGEITHYAPHIRTKESFLKELGKDFGIGAREFSDAGIKKGRKLQGTINDLVERGIDIFEKNPAVQLSKKGEQYAKAITSKQFTDDIARFALKDGGVEVTNPLLKGMKFQPEQAKVIDNFYQGIKPEEIKTSLKYFDKIQNWWKGQALVAPSYHIRNVAGNLWNNYIAGVNPADYAVAGMLQKNPGRNAELLEQAQKLGVLNEGWYAADIGDAVLNKADGLSWKKRLNPLSQQNWAFQLNQATGSMVENNARLAHFISMYKKTGSYEKAAQSVKKYLFDYADLTSFEKNILKRAIPFYTWSRKNLPVQLEGLLTQPAKYTLPHKLVERIESGVEVPDERYMSPYLTENVPIRIGKDDEGNTKYFLLGSWLPYASAIDLLSQPLDSLIGMSTPLVKNIYEQSANKSLYFKTTTGERSPIERKPPSYGEFWGKPMRKKNISLLRNIRILSDMNRWFDKQDPTATKNSWGVKLINTLFGRAGTYDVRKSKFFYDLDTQEYIKGIKSSIKWNAKRGFKEKAQELREELREFQARRQRGE